ncbi:hypothetical protein [Streptomyces sp. DT203]|uniref:hypothetical protein n=1 Tax=Streptomyces sp. DT203 TaxID=3393424 RepID=UPI003CF66B89
MAYARERFSTALSAVVGQSVHRAWDAADQTAFAGLHTPISSEQSEADTQILILGKGVIEYLSTKNSYRNEFKRRQQMSAHPRVRKAS